MNMTSNDKSTRISAAERLKVAPGQTLQDLYKPKSSDPSPTRSSENSSNDYRFLSERYFSNFWYVKFFTIWNDHVWTSMKIKLFSPNKRRNRSKNRFNSMHRLTSIVEEKDIIAAKEMFSPKSEENSVPAEVVTWPKSVSSLSSSFASYFRSF